MTQFSILTSEVIPRVPFSLIVGSALQFIYCRRRDCDAPSKQHDYQLPNSSSSLFRADKKIHSTLLCKFLLSPFGFPLRHGVLRSIFGRKLKFPLSTYLLRIHTQRPLLLHPKTLLVSMKNSRLLQPTCVVSVSVME